MSNNIFNIAPLVERLEKAAQDWPSVPASLGALLNEAADIIRMQDELIERPRALSPEGGERWVKDAARYRKLVSQAVEGDWGCHTGWRLNVDIKGAPSIENIDDAIDAQFSLPIPTQKDRS